MSIDEGGFADSQSQGSPIGKRYSPYHIGKHYRAAMWLITLAICLGLHCVIFPVNGFELLLYVKFKHKLQYNLCQ
jgi:hypothetical protein